MEIINYIRDLKLFLDKINREEIERVIDFIFDACIRDKNIFIMGNGGSASNASHLAQDLSRVIVVHDNKGKSIKAISIADNISFITTVANDFGFENIFTAQLKTFANAGDILIAISCSGNSKNIIDAVNYAHSINMKVLAITAYNGGKLKDLSDLNIHIPVHDFGIAESIHSAIFHYLPAELRFRYGTI